MSDPREPLGRRVRDTWNGAVDELRPGARPSWRKRWDELNPQDPEDAFQIEVDNRIGAALAEPFEDLLAAVWLYIDWRWITTQLTTEQKELFADAVDAHGQRVAAEEGPMWGEPTRVCRWWRDDTGDPR
jgi:hypothetical protein